MMTGQQVKSQCYPIVNMDSTVSLIIMQWFISSARQYGFHCFPDNTVVGYL